MKHLSVWGYYGFGNVGDEALLSALARNLQTERLSIFSGNTNSVLDHKHFAFESRNPKNLFSVIKKTDGFVLGPGGLLHERKNAKGTWYHLAGAFASQLYKKPYCAVGQQIGSFSRSSTKLLVKQGLRKASFISVRDEKSFSEAKTLNLKPTLSADFAFLLESDEPSKEIAEKIRKLPKPRFIFAPAISENFTPDIKATSNMLNQILEKTSGSLVMIPFFQRKDDKTISEISPLIKSRNLLSLVSPISWQDAFGVFRMVNFSIPIRLHSMIASALSGIPFLPIVYHEKIKSIGCDLGCGYFIEDLGNIENTFDEFYKKIGESKKEIPKMVLKMRERAGISVKLLRAFIDEID